MISTGRWYHTRYRRRLAGGGLGFLFLLALGLDDRGDPVGKGGRGERSGSRVMMGRRRGNMTTMIHIVCRPSLNR